MIKPAWQLKKVGRIITLSDDDNAINAISVSQQVFQECFPKFKCLFKLMSRRQRVIKIAVRKPIIKFLEALTDDCWWLSRDYNYSIWLYRPVFWEKRMFMGQDDEDALVEMCGNIFEEIYPHLKMRKNTVKPINKISFIRR